MKMRERKISDLDNRPIEIIHSAQQRVNRLKSKQKRSRFLKIKRELLGQREPQGPLGQ